MVQRHYTERELWIREKHAYEEQLFSLKSKVMELQQATSPNKGIAESPIKEEQQNNSSSSSITPISGTTSHPSLATPSEAAPASASSTGGESAKVLANTTGNEPAPAFVYQTNAHGGVIGHESQGNPSHPPMYGHPPPPTSSAGWPQQVYGLPPRPLIPMSATGPPPPPSNGPYFAYPPPSYPMPGQASPYPKPMFYGPPPTSVHGDPHHHSHSRPLYMGPHYAQSDSPMHHGQVYLGHPPPGRPGMYTMRPSSNSGASPTMSPYPKPSVTKSPSLQQARPPFPDSKSEFF
jgi:hypothetical protein